MIGFGGSTEPEEKKAVPEEKETTNTTVDRVEVENKLDGEVLGEAPGSLQLYERSKHQYQVKVKSSILFLVDCGDFKYVLSVWQGNSMRFRQTLTSDIGLSFDGLSKSITWYTPINGMLQLFRFKYSDAKAGDNLNNFIVEKKMEASQGVKFTKAVHKEDRGWVYDAELEDKMGGKVPIEEESEDDSDYEMLKEQWVVENTPKKKKKDEQNSFLETGMASDNSFIFRGSEIGIFRHGKDEELKYAGKIQNVQTKDGQTFTPSKGQLHQSDKKMLLLHPTDKSKVICYDIEYGKVVEEWEGHEDFKFRDISKIDKYAQLTDQNMITGVNRNMIFSIDPRVSSKNKIAEEKTFKTNLRMSCLEVNQKGQLVVGSTNGEIRLFSNCRTRCKTLLPGLGDPIKGIDTTADGNWLLATCENYLILVPTSLGSGKTGFDVTMRKKEKPIPVKLHLSPEDICDHKIPKISFTKAHFNTGESKTEKFIVTSTGPFVITWNFATIKKYGKFAKYNYTIRSCGSDVVADKFRYNTSNVVVTLENNVLMQKLKKRKERRANMLRRRKK